MDSPQKVKSDRKRRDRQNEKKTVCYMCSIMDKKDET